VVHGGHKIFSLFKRLKKIAEISQNFSLISWKSTGNPFLKVYRHPGIELNVKYIGFSHLDSFDVWLSQALINATVSMLITVVSVVELSTEKLLQFSTV
jgi:hypothetical protein